jgi:hypothetical protein
MTAKALWASPLVKAGIILCSLLLASIAAGNARPPPGANSELAPWFNSLQSYTGESCCGVADCRGPQDYPIRIIDGDYEVFVDQQWLKIPKAAISQRTDNPTGNFVTCVQENYWEAGERKPRVMCFFRSSGT